MSPSPQAASATSATENPKQRLWQQLLRCAAEDLSDPGIRADAARLEQERQVVLKRLAPHIEDIVQLAWRQLQQDQSSVPSSRSRP